MDIRLFRVLRASQGLCAANKKCLDPPVAGQLFCQFHRRAAQLRAFSSRYGGLTLNEFLINQNNCCLLCGKPFDGTGVQKMAPVIDHDHVNGNIRGAIHQRCNIGLGMFEDNVDLLYAAIQYLNTKRLSPGKVA